MTQIMPVQTFGEFTDTIPAGEEYLTLRFAPSSAPRKRRWRNYGLSADFLGDYFAAFFPGDAMPDSKINQRDTVKAAVSYIANELIENAVKYTEDSTHLPISISLYLYDRQIIFHATNYASQVYTQHYQRFIREVLSSTLDDFYMRQLEKAATGTDGSSMGILTMMNDYNARFGWKFQPLEKEPTLVQVEVLVYLDV